VANYTIPDVGKNYLLKYKLGLAGAADLHLAKLHLCVAGTTFRSPLRGELLTDFVEASFPGYAAQPVGPWSGTLYDSANFLYYSLSQVCVFTSTDAVNSYTILGWYLTDAGAANLIAFIQYSPGDVIPPLGSLAIQLTMEELSLFNN
jgi:hypothetical protein